MNLTIGAIDDICNGDKSINPIFQINGVKLIDSKIRLNINDGLKSYSFVLLISKYIDLVKTGEIASGKKIKVNKYCTKKQDSKVIILLLDVDVLKDTSTNIESPFISTQQCTKYLNTPIRLLSCHHTCWSITGRCCSKSKIVTWNKPTGAGKLFNFTLADNGGDIQITCFNNEVDEFYELLEINKVYSVSNGQLKLANRQYNKTKSNFEIRLNQDSVVIKVVDSASVPQISYNFVPIKKISDKAVESLIDVVGVVHSITDMVTIMSQKLNKELWKRDVILVDQSGFSVTLTLWNDEIGIVEGLKTPTLVLRKAMVREYHGKQLSVSTGTTILVNTASVPEAVALAGWYQETGHSTIFIPIGGESGGSFSNSQGQQDVSLLYQVVISSAQNDNVEFFTVHALVTAVKSANFVYKACSNEGCNKKVEELGDGLYRCPKCDKLLDFFKYRLLVNVKLTDISDSKWVTCFHEVTEIILGKRAAVMGQLAECKETLKLDKIFKNALFDSMYFKLKAKKDNYNEEIRLKLTAFSVIKKNQLEEIETFLLQLN